MVVKAVAGDPKNSASADQQGAAATLLAGDLVVDEEFA